VDNFVKNVLLIASKPRKHWLCDGLMKSRAEKNLYKSKTSTYSLEMPSIFLRAGLDRL
jgi:hypothetical protein